jgi:hypothetical protein
MVKATDLIAASAYSRAMVTSRPDVSIISMSSSSACRPVTARPSPVGLHATLPVGVNPSGMVQASCPVAVSSTRTAPSTCTPATSRPSG